MTDGMIGSAPGTERDLTGEERTLLARWEDVSNDLINARSLSDSVSHTLAGAIIDRELPSGWLLREERLGALFSVSRTPVREALARLATANLCRRDSRGSLRVTAVTPEQILNVYAVRQRLEGLSAALAAEVATPRVVARLKQLNEACERAAAAADYDEFARVNTEFHTAMAQSTGNEMLVRFLEDVHNWVKRFPTTTLSFPGRPESALAEHRQIIAAIEGRDGELAERVAREHMRVSEEVRIQMFLEETSAVTPRS
jgi:DNA-binding GntR family transcriptional regulator